MVDDIVWSKDIESPDLLIGGQLSLAETNQVFFKWPNRPLFLLLLLKLTRSNYIVYFISTDLK